MGRIGPDAPAGPAAPAGTGTTTGPPSRAAVRVAVVGLAVVLVGALVSVVRSALLGRLVTPYVAPQFWLSYEDGFVRRGLPGALTRLLAGGRTPTLALADAVGVGLSALAVLAVVALALLLARRAADHRTGVAVAAAVLVTPLGLSLYARDLGRPDAVGVVVLVALAALPWRRWPTAPAAALAAGLTTAAVATEEFLVALVLPLGLVVLASAWVARRHHRAWLALTLAPAAALAALSAVVPAPPAVLARAVVAARAAGVPPSLPLAPGLADHDAVSRLGHGFWDNTRTYYALTSVPGVVAATLLCAGLHLLVVGLVWRLLGRPLRQRAFVLLAGLPALVALALSVAGIDYRRWWALAVVAALAAVLHRTGGGSRSPAPTGRHLGAALVTLAVAGVLLQTMPLWPPRSWTELVSRMLGAPL